MERDRFAALCQKLLAKIGLPGPYVFDEEMFDLTHVDNQRKIGLHNAFVVYKHAPFWSRKKHLKKFLEAFKNTDGKSAFGSFEDDVDRLMPGIRHRAYVEYGSEIAIPFRSLTSSIIVVLLLDNDTAMTVVTQEALSGWDIEFDQALKIAITNLTRISQTPWVAANNDVFVSASSDDYDASRILVDDFMNSVPLAGPLIVFVPDRNTLAVTHLDNDAGIQTLLKNLEKHEAPGLISSLPMVYDRGSFHEWHPAEAHQNAFHKLQLIESADLYNTQKPTLEKELEQDLEPAFVASFMVAQSKSPEGGMFSCATLSKGVPTYLPKVERVLLIASSPDEEPTVVGDVAWDLFADTMTSDLKATDHYPTRYLIETFPTDTQLETMLSQEDRSDQV